MSNSSINSIPLFGNLTRDVELKYTSTGLAIANGGIAVSRWRKDKEDYVSFFDFKLFGKTAEAFAKYHGRGSKALISGYPEQERWDDKTTGKARSKVVFTINSFEFVGDKSDGGSTADAPAKTDKALPRNF